MPSAVVTIKWIELGTSRAFIVARVPHVVMVGRDADPETGRYRQWIPETTEREQNCFLWRRTTTGALIAALCDRAADKKWPLRVTYEETPWGWKLTDAALVERE